VGYTGRDPNFQTLCPNCKKPIFFLWEVAPDNKELANATFDLECRDGTPVSTSN
jgi:hypothetical protein